MNGAYFVAVLRLGQAGDIYDVNSGNFTLLEGFAMFIAGIVAFKVFFAFFNILSWKYKYYMDDRYKITRCNLEKEFKKLKKDQVAAESSDDAEDRAYMNS